jgi:hypothetical protein
MGLIPVLTLSHKGTSFPLMPWDREGRQRRASAQYRLSISGFPPPVVSRLACLAVPELEILIGNHSHEMGYLK